MDYKSVVAETARRFDNLEFSIGDIYHEMYSYMFFIADISNGKLLVYEGHPTNQKIKVYYFTPDEFREKCKSGGSYWVDFMKNEYRYAEQWLSNIYTNTGTRQGKIARLEMNYDENLARFMDNRTDALDTIK